MKIVIFLAVVTLAFARQGDEEEKKTCKEEPDGGMCRGYFEMFYYDTKLRQCQTFIYGGCGGNSNRYSTEEECEANCIGNAVQNLNSVCELPANQGLCFAAIKRYFFDMDSGVCKIFMYGGCGGNANNFRTLEECEKTCQIE